MVDPIVVGKGLGELNQHALLVLDYQGRDQFQQESDWVVPATLVGQQMMLSCKTTQRNRQDGLHLCGYHCLHG